MVSKRLKFMVRAQVAQRGKILSFSTRPNLYTFTECPEKKREKKNPSTAKSILKKKKKKSVLGHTSRFRGQAGSKGLYNVTTDNLERVQICLLSSVLSQDKCMA